MSTSKFFIGFGKFLGAVGGVAIILMWIANVNGGKVFGLTGEHLFYNVVGLPLLSLVCLVIGYGERKG
jgi:hypothetical protein